MNPILVTVILCIVCVAAGIAAGFFAGERYRKHTAELAIGSAEEEAKRIVNDAIKSAEGKKKEAVLEGNL